MSNISGNAYGAAAYQQTNSLWSNGGRRGDAVKTAEERRAAREGKAADAKGADGTDKASTASETSATAKTRQPENVATNNNVKTIAWSNKGISQIPIPSYNKDYGTVIGDVSLSKEASDYYDKLKAKYGGMDFILVSKDQKAAVQANVSRYGNAKKPVVLIDDEKLERMATDKDFREKYEAIISMAQNQLASMKNELSSSGATIRNFGMSVKSDGSTDYFAVMQKSGKEQAERIEKKRIEKAEAKKEAKKTDRKKLQEKREAKKAEQKKIKEKSEVKKAEQKKLQEKHEAKKPEHRETEDKDVAGRAEDKKASEYTEDKQVLSGVDSKGYIHRSYTELSSSSLDDLVSVVRDAAYTRSLENVQTAAEKVVGQSIDFKG